MPLRKKNATRKKILIIVLALVFIVLMIISFPPIQNVNEIVLYPK